jgi:nicotinate-nucleotide adenylyltransferase
MIGIFGGTFDPIHFGHLRPVAEVARALRLAEVRFIPAGTPPHRARPRAEATHRLCMVELALRDEASFRVDDRELRRAGPSYTVDTLSSLRAELGAMPLCLIVGMDAFLGLPTWHDWPRLFAQAHIAVMHRPGWHLQALPAWAAERLCPEPARLHETATGLVWLQAVAPQDISASAIRARRAQGLSIAGLVPPAVADYIDAHQLYTQEHQPNAGKEEGSDQEKAATRS